ncbi:MAG TPA: CARDB domain-containing protein, partial [Thermodesulfovibrionales bacterium]|nr:CARDB domain-containing protein [Thermodesulfovibrionales bacterium]
KTVYITDITININYGPANASTTAFYMSTTSDLTGKVGSAFCSRSVPALPGATASGPVTTTCTIPAVAVGTYYVVANADDGNTSGETNKANNTRAFGPVSIVANNVDLQVSASSYAPSSAKRGTSISVTDIIINLGSGTAGPSQTGIYLMTSCPAPSATPPPLANQIGTRSVPSIPGGGSNSGTTSVTIPLTATVGANYIVFYADWQNAVVETNETNNARCRAITIQ